VNGASINRWWIVQHYIGAVVATIFALNHDSPRSLDWLFVVYLFAEGSIQVFLDRYQRAQMAAASAREGQAEARRLALRNGETADSTRAVPASSPPPSKSPRRLLAQPSLMLVQTGGLHGANDASLSLWLILPLLLALNSFQLFLSARLAVAPPPPSASTLYAPLASLLLLLLGCGNVIATLKTYARKLRGGGGAAVKSE
jgi:hypothetical protein